MPDLSLSPALGEIFVITLIQYLRESVVRLSDAVVWNPWPEKAEAMADLGFNHSQIVSAASSTYIFCKRR